VNTNSTFTYERRRQERKWENSPRTEQEGIEIDRRLSSTAGLVTDPCKELQHRDYQVKRTRRLYVLEAVFASAHRFRAMVCGGWTISP
jgi:hypothetical protein